MRIVRCADLLSIRNGRNIEVAGVILVRQRPGSAKGVLFITIEDETGVAQGILWPDRFDIYRRQVMSASMIAMRGRLQKEGEVRLFAIIIVALLTCQGASPRPDVKGTLPSLHAHSSATIAASRGRGHIPAPGWAGCRPWRLREPRPVNPVGSSRDAAEQPFYSLSC